MNITPIGIIRTPFKDKFGIPRQQGLSESAWGIIELDSHPFFQQALYRLDSFTHIWIIFHFHKHDAKAWKPTIRPPRLGGRERVGVLASRSPHRPNPIGMSCVKLDRIEGNKVYVSGVDLLDETPILDIKPYLPYADIISDAGSGWAETPIERVKLEWSQPSLDVLKNNPDLKAIAEEVISLDPRPAFQKRKFPVHAAESIGLKFGARVLDFDVRWTIKENFFHIDEIIPYEKGNTVKGKKNE